MPWLQVQLFTSWQIMEKRITEPRIAQLVQSLSTSYILFTTVLLGIHPEREPSLLGEWICSSLYNRLSLISFPFLPEYLLYLHTVPHVRETVASKTDQLLLPWSLQKGNQPKDWGGGCAVENAVVGNAKEPQSRFEELEERLGQVMRKENCSPGPRKSMFKVQEVKNWSLKRLINQTKLAKLIRLKGGRENSTNTIMDGGTEHQVNDKRLLTTPRHH